MPCGAPVPPGGWCPDNQQPVNNNLAPNQQNQNNQNPQNNQPVQNNNVQNPQQPQNTNGLAGLIQQLIKMLQDLLSSLK